MTGKKSLACVMVVFITLVLVISACTTQPAAETPVSDIAVTEVPASDTAPASAPTTSGEKVTLEYWLYADYAQGDALELQKTFISEFEASHPGVTINIAGKNDADLTTGMIAGAASGNIPDVFMNSTADGAKLVDAGVLTNVYDQWMAMPEAYRNQFNQTLITNMSNESGKMWGVPYTAYASFLYRNLTVLKAAGIDPNEDVADWDAWMKQMEKINGAGYKSIHMFTNESWDFANIYSGVANNDEWGIDFTNSKTLMNPDKVAQTMEFLLKIKPYSSSSGIFDQATTDMFISNQLAFMVNGPWANPTFEEAKANSGLDYDYVLIPGTTTDQKGGVQGTEFLGVAPNAHVDLAWEFVTYLCDEPQMSRWAQLLGRYNSNETTLSTVQHPLLNITTKAAVSALFNQPPFFVKSYPANYNQAIVDDMSAVYEGQLTPQEGAANLITDLNAVLAEE